MASILVEIHDGEAEVSPSDAEVFILNWDELDHCSNLEELAFRLDEVYTRASNIKDEIQREQVQRELDWYAKDAGLPIMEEVKG